MKIGLALGSGSARGWSHIGIIEALAELDIHPEIVCGTSIGSIVGAAYATGNLGRLKQRVCALTKLNTASYFNFSMSIDGFVNKEKLRAFFADCVTPPGMLIEDLPVRYASVATEVSTGREYWLKKGPLEEAIWSSISLPGLFPPVFYHDRWLFDGGLVNPVPISVCRALGADIVLAVNLNGELIGRHSAKKKPKENKEGEGDFVERIAMTIRQYGTTLFGENESPAHHPPSVFGTIASAVDIVQDRITRSRMAGDPPDIFLTPRLAHVGLLEFYKAEEVINEGKACVSRALTKAIDMTDDPGERQGDILSRHAATLGRHLKSSPCPQFFPTPHPCSRWRHSWADGFPPGCCSSASCAPFCRMPTSSASGSASAMPTRSGTGGFPIPSRLPCSWAVLASEWPRCSCAVHASWDSPSAFWPSQAISCWTQ